MNTTSAAPAIKRPPRRTPLPPRARSPLILLAAVAAPQSLLLVLNLRDGLLMAGEMNPAQRQTAGFLLIAELILLLGTSALALRYWRRRTAVPWVVNWAVILPHLGYLVLFTLALERDRLVPATVARWMVQPEQLLFHQGALLLPAVFIALLALACVPTRLGRFPDFGLSLAATVGVPLFWYGAMRLIDGVNVPGTVIVILAIASVLLCLGGFLRLMTGLYVWTEAKGPAGRYFLALAVGLLGPLGGLALNAHIPFPADFQAPWAYLLAVVNGLVLSFPATNRPRFDRAIWLARCALIPFTAYFFLVFLPFLPLAIPAMAFFGAGFLMLVPTALMIVQTQLVLRGVEWERKAGLGAGAIPCALLAAAVLPATLLGSALLDRGALHQAMKFVFTPDHRANERFAGNLTFTRRALEHLRDQKTGAYLPFLTEAYEQIVFDGMTLGVSKMQALHTAFFGAPLALPSRESDDLFTWRSRPRRSVQVTPFPQTVRLTGLETSSRAAEGAETTTVRLTLKNIGAAQAEYVVPIHVPPGVLVSGYWLHIGEERVPGRIHEKKAALWVYEMIRDVTRRDPGVLTYTGPETLALRVFPFAGGETRVTEIEFLAPAGMGGVIRVGDREVPLPGQSHRMTLVKAGHRSEFVVPPALSTMLPEMTRRPFLHFLVDRSAGSPFTPAAALSAMRRVAAQFPEVDHYLVSVANYESHDLTLTPRSIRHLGALNLIPEAEWQPRRGGLLEARALKRSLLAYKDRLAQSAPGSPWFEQYPIFVVLTASGQSEVDREDLGWFAAAVPDTEGYYRADPAGTLTAVPFASAPGTAPSARHPVRLFRGGGSVVATRAEGSAVLGFPRAVDPEAVEVYDPLRASFEAVPSASVEDASGRYARGVTAFQDAAEQVENPSLTGRRLPATVRASRAAGVLVPSTAYIVVENSAQWKILERSENRKLGGHRDLDLMETPEPEAEAVALLTALLAVLRRRAGRRHLPRPALGRETGGLVPGGRG